MERFATQIQRDMADPHALREDALQDSADQGGLGSGSPRDPGRRGWEDAADPEAGLTGYAATPRPGVLQLNPLRG